MQQALRKEKDAPGETDAQLAEELAKVPYEPFLPVERKLVTWSLILGVGLLVILVLVFELL